MKWEKIPIASVCSGIYDGPHATPPESNSGAVFLGISNFVNGRLDLSDIRYISESDLPKWTKRVVPQKHDIVFSYEATLNLYAIIPDDFRGCLGRRMALIRVDESKAHYKYLYYYFYSPAWRAVISEHTVIGATVDRIPLISFPNFPIELPDLPTQHRIASILSAYDDLIENNRRQIKLLEEAAQRLYREWFVELRFPGHEDVKIVDGVPEGWKYGCIKELILYHDTMRKPLSSKERASFQGKYRYYGAAGILDHVAEYLYDGTYLLLGEDGSVITADGYPVLQYVSGQFWVNNHAHVLQGKPPFSTEYIYMMFQHTKVSDIVTGVAQPKISQNRLSNKKVLIPHEKYATMYCTYVRPYFQRILLLKNQIEVAQEAHDRLLPKLMSGEMEV